MEAGLPNIEGRIDIDRIGAKSTASGAFYKTTRVTSGYGTAKPGYDMTFTFDASLSSPVYGNSETVTPESLAVLILIKY